MIQNMILYHLSKRSLWLRLLIILNMMRKRTYAGMVFGAVRHNLLVYHHTVQLFCSCHLFRLR
jgi:hypothetical protein